MKKEFIYLAGHHDRHTDDVFVAFKSELNAKNQCQEWMRSWKSVEENVQYGDWCLFVNDDYYAFVQMVELK